MATPFTCRAFLGACLFVVTSTACVGPRPAAGQGGLSGGMTPEIADEGSTGIEGVERTPAPELAIGPNVEQPAEAVDASSTVLAYVAGEPIDVRDLLAHWMHRDSRTVYDFTDRLVTARLALAEAGRLGITIDPALVDQRLIEAQNSLTEALVPRGIELERFLVQELGLDPTRYFELLRDETVEQLLTERAVRAWTLAEERADVAVIVLANEDDLQIAKQRLDAGEDFSDVAREMSMDASALDGGVIPPVVKSEFSRLSMLAFRTEVGSWGGPVEEGGNHILIQVNSRPEILKGNWAENGAAVEADLVRAPIEDPEYWQWRTAMGHRYEIDLRPMYDLVGEPQR